MTRTTEIRRATADDAESIAAILRGMGPENVGLAGPFDAERARNWLKRLGDDGAIFLACEGSGKATLVIVFAQERKDVNNTFAQHFIATETRDSLHGSIPGYESAIAIKREHTLDARVDHAL